MQNNLLTDEGKTWGIRNLVLQKDADNTVVRIFIENETKKINLYLISDGGSCDLYGT